MAAGGGGEPTPVGDGASKSLAREIAQSYMYVALWIGLSAAVILYNKWVLYFYAFPFPLALTLFHMAFCSVLAFVAVRVLGIVKPLQSMTAHQYTRQVVPIGALYAASLWFSNSAYLYLSVSFIQMLKALMPVAVYSVGIFFKKEKYSPATMLNMVVISVGVAIASFGELLFDTTGFAMQLAAIACEASRLVLVQILLTGRGITMNPITSLYYISPCCFAFLLPAFAYFELPFIMALAEAEAAGHGRGVHFGAGVFLSNASVAFLLNLAVFLLIGKTSALTMNVAGVVKDWLLIALSSLLFAAPVSALNLAGYFLAFLAVCWYNYAKLQQMKARDAGKKHHQPHAHADDDADEEMLPLLVAPAATPSSTSSAQR